MAPKIIGRAAKLAPLVSIPLYACPVAAGFPSPADDFIEERIDLNRMLVKNKDATYFVNATGDSMVDAGIQPGNFLVIDSSLAADAKDGMIVVACIDDQTTVKRLRFINGQTWLYPENQAKGYKPIRITEEMDFRVWGVVRSITQQLIR